MVGIPDGTGAWDDEDDEDTEDRWEDRDRGRDDSKTVFNFVNNHELGKTSGVPRAHGSKGAFVARWLIDRRTGKVLSGRDHLTSPNNVMTWNGLTYVPGTTTIDRLCSADLPKKSAFFQKGWKGTPHRIFLSGEETAPPNADDHG
ncbi:MAG: phytase, partial [Methylocella sp.]